MLDLPRIGLGTWQTFDVNASHYAARSELVREFIALGGTVIDASPMYGRAEETVGAVRAAADPEHRLFLATKVWTRGRDAGVAQMEESLRRLHTSRIDLMQVHNLVDVETHLRTLRAWQAEGRVRYIGITHYTASAHREVAAVLEREAVDALRINYSVAEREAEARLLPLAAERGVAVIVNRPFAEGALMKRLTRRPVPDWAAEVGCDTWAPLLLKFVISHPAVTCAIPATSSLAHLRANMSALRGPMPDAAMRERIARAAS